ncbi:MAG: DUF763 domain-containing protein [Candidatus Thermoplasmatota archaeon]|nr:DUF763 domain-containing protein [Candidatus Thermoplasmatota archaeon]
MTRAGVADLPLHPGRAPRWLFVRMVGLSKGILKTLCLEFGTERFLERISDPFWFQALSCVLGFDWHSSGVTTVTCGALKEALKGEELGIAIAGGKGRASRKTPQQIEQFGEQMGISSQAIDDMAYTSRISAKVDNTAIQDGHQLYHHVFMFSERGSWTIIQQGMNEESGYARRYHWYHAHVDDVLEEPHDAILGTRVQTALDMTSRLSGNCKSTSLDVAREGPRRLRRLFSSVRPPNQSSLKRWTGEEDAVRALRMPRNINWSAMRAIYDFQPSNYEEMLAIRGVGPSTVRALALISDLIYGDEPSWRDPVKYSFTVGGKDGVPYPVDRRTMDESIHILESGIEESKLRNKEKIRALRRMRRVIPNGQSVR